MTIKTHDNRNPFTCIIGILFALLLAANLATGKEPTHQLRFSNGDQLSGQVMEFRGGRWIFNSSQLGRIQVPAEKATVIGANDKPMSPEQWRAQMTQDTTDASTTDASTTHASYTQESTPSQKPKHEPHPWYAGWADSRLGIPESWEGEITIGITDISGTSDKSSIAWASSATIPWDIYEFKWRTYYNYSESNNTKDVDDYGSSLRFRRRLSDRSFIQSGSKISVDQIQGVDLQFDQTLGYGYKIFKQEDLQYSVVPGIAYQFKDQPGTEDGGAISGNYNQELTWKIIENLKFTHNFDLFLPADNTNDFSFILSHELQTNIGGNYIVKIAHDFDFDNEVAPGTENYTSTFSTSLGFSF